MAETKDLKTLLYAATKYLEMYIVDQSCKAEHEINGQALLMAHRLLEESRAALGLCVECGCSNGRHTFDCSFADEDWQCFMI